MDEGTPKAMNMAFCEVLNHALDHSLEHLEHLEHSSVDATASHADLLRRFDRTLASTETEASQVIDELVEAARGGVLGTAGGRFFGWVNGGAFPVALAADWITSTWNQCATIYAAGPAPAVMEEITGVWLKDLLRLPSQASFALVTGCQMAHFTCLGAARHSLLSKRGWDVEQNGLNDAPCIYILTSSERHGSIERAVRMLGLGRRSIVSLPVDETGSLSPVTLANALAKYAKFPTIVVL